VTKLAVAAVAVGLLVVPAGAALGAGELSPVLRVVRVQPYTVQGAHFTAYERVTVTLTSGKRWATVAAANANGLFTATLPGGSIGKCSAYTVRAVGARGDSALFKTAACRKPSANVVFRQGVIVVGTHFKPGERLTVTLIGAQTWTQRTRANASGSFQVDLGSIALNACNAYTLKVVGTLGSRFTFLHAVQPC